MKRIHLSCNRLRLEYVVGPLTSYTVDRQIVRPARIRTDADRNKEPLTRPCPRPGTPSVNPFSSRMRTLRRTSGRRWAGFPRHKLSVMVPNVTLRVKEGKYPWDGMVLGSEMIRGYQSRSVRFAFTSTPYVLVSVHAFFIRVHAFVAPFAALSH